METRKSCFKRVFACNFYRSAQYDKEVMASKDSTMKSHAKRRFDERYGINLSELVHQQIVQRIQSGFNARFLMSQSNRISVWAVNLMNMAIPGDCPSTIPVVYDKERKMLVTALPVACLDINQIGIYLD